MANRNQKGVSLLVHAANEASKLRLEDVQLRHMKERERKSSSCSATLFGSSQSNNRRVKIIQFWLQCKSVTSLKFTSLTFLKFCLGNSLLTYTHGFSTVSF